MIQIVDYGMGNLRSVANALESLGVACRISSRPEDLESADRVILPGVGAFGEAMKRLDDLGLRRALEREVGEKKKPLLGICLGMELLADRSFEHGEHRGLGWIPGDVVRIEPTDSSLRVPHIGWNEAAMRTPSPLFENMPPSPTFYFVHSYRYAASDPKDVTAVCDYGGEIVAAVERGHVFGVQFHPEKSHTAGLALLRNFAAFAA